MSNCNVCEKPVRQTQKITCTRTSCARSFHFICVGLNSENAKKSTSWICPLCLSKQPRGDNSNTPIRSNTEQDPAGNVDDGCSVVPTKKPNPHMSKAVQPLECSTDHRSDILDSLKGELQVLVRNAVKSELGTMEEQMSTIESTVSYMSTQYDDLFNTIKATCAEIKGLKDENARLRSDMSVQEKRIQLLEEENARQQQWSRLQNIEVAGVPESKDEDTIDIVVKLAEKIGVPIESSEVEFAHRVQARQPNSSVNGRTIIARFRHRRTKDSVVAASRRHRGIKPSDIGMDNRLKNDNSIIYVNEHLTKYNRTLLKECKLKAKEANFKFTWTKNCRIFVRRNETSPPIPIITTADLKKLG